jgi:two-component system, chemotaxis family, sensor kinase Cph1
VSVAIGDEPQSFIREVLKTEAVEHNPLYVCTLDARHGVPSLDLSMHTVDGVVVAEFEATSRGEGPTIPNDYWLVKRSVARLQAATTLVEFCQFVCEEIRALTQLDRVMVYKFHADTHGEVFAESRRKDLAPWLGLHYPAEDIPTPVREVFRRIWIRPLVDVQGDVAELVPLLNPETGKPLTMTYCALRAASVMYTEYLQNMGVRASLTMPIRRDDKLWGLIACHHYTPALVPYRIRAACEHLAQVVSLQHKAAADREHFVYRLQMEEVHQRLVALAARTGGLEGLIGGKPNLLDAMDASGVALYHRNRWWCVGNTPATNDLDALGEWLKGHFSEDSSARSVYATDSLSVDYPPASTFRAAASGLLAVPLSRNAKHLLLWFRPETIQTVQWGGNPHEKPLILGPHGPRLTPRKSFEVFVESVSGRSLPWKDVEIDAAIRLRVLIMELVVGHAERLAQLNEDLTRSNEELDAFAYVASHDLKEPLRGIHKYAHQLLEDTALIPLEDPQAKLQALMRLAIRMDNLLDSLLHFSRVGRMVLQRENIDLGEVVSEALEIIAARRTDRPTKIIIPRPLPTAFADRIRVREIFVNLFANALKYNDQVERTIEIGFVAPNEGDERAHAPPETAHQFIYYVRDNGIGIQSKHYEQIFKMFRRLHARDQYGGGTGAGLTITKKLVERHHGRIWLSSTPGRGTTFFFTLPEENSP